VKPTKTVIALSLFALLTTPRISFGMLECFLCKKKRKRMIKVPATEFYKMTQKKQNDTETRLKEELQKIFPKVEEVPEDDFARDIKFTMALEGEIDQIYEYTHVDFGKMDISNEHTHNWLIGIANLKFLSKMKELGYHKKNLPPKEAQLDDVFKLHIRMLGRLKRAQELDQEQQLLFK